MLGDLLAQGVFSLCHIPLDCRINSAVAAQFLHRHRKLEVGLVLSHIHLQVLFGVRLAHSAAVLCGRRTVVVRVDSRVRGVTILKQ